MLHRVQLILLFSVIAHTAFAQFRQRRRINDHDEYIEIGSGIGFVPLQSDGLYRFSFPYTVTDASGNVQNFQFTKQSYLNHSAAAGRGLTGSVGAEMGTKRGFFRYQVSFGQNGYNSACFMGAIFNFRLSPHQQCITFKPSFGLGYTDSFEGPSVGGDWNNLGVIDNAGKTITIGNQSFGPTYIYDNHTRQATNLNLSYVRQELTLIPTIFIGRSNFEHFLNFGFTVSYYIPFREHTAIRFDEDSYNEQNVWLNRGSSTPITASYNGGSIASPHGAFTQWFVGFHLGLNVAVAMNSISLRGYSHAELVASKLCDCKTKRKIHKPHRIKHRKAVVKRGGEKKENTLGH